MPASHMVYGSVRRAVNRSRYVTVPTCMGYGSSNARKNGSNVRCQRQQRVYRGSNSGRSRVVGTTYNAAFERSVAFEWNR